MRYPQLAGHIFNTPLLIEPSKLDAIIAGLSDRFGVNDFAPEKGIYTTQQGERKKPGYRVVGNVAVLDIFGALAHHGGMAADSSYILGYQTMARWKADAMASKDVEAIVMNMSTPGGEVAGAFDMADDIYSSRNDKPIYAIASDMAASAGYLIGSAATSFSVTQTGYAGSIGVVMRHADFSKQLSEDGIKVTHIFAGKHKVDGNPYEPLPKDVRARFQEEIESVYGMFVDAVVRHRGMTAEQVRNTEAQVYMGQKAVDIGLADRVETPDQLISRLTAEYGGAGSRQFIFTSKEQTTMSQEPEKKPTAAKASGGDQPATASEPETVDTAAVAAEATANATTNERARIKAITTCEAAEGRKDLADHFAYDTSMSIDEAQAALAKAPKQVTAKASKLDQAMAGEDQPELGAEGEGVQISAADEIMNDFRQAKGIVGGKQ